MNNTINFILESGVSLALLSIIYLIFLRRETFFKLNRLFLLASILFSLILPFLKFKIYEPKSVMLAEITVTPYRNLVEAVTVYGQGFSGGIEQLVLSANLIILVYLAGVVFFIGRFIFRIIQLYTLVGKNQVQPLNGFKLIVLDEEISPFSFLKYIFVSRSIVKSDDYEKIIAHELEHAKQGHSFDVIILEILTFFQWFNPFMWMLRRSIRENHEYLADQAVLTSGVNRGYYKKLLLNQFVGGQLVIANNFNYSLIKKRIKMMSKIKSSKIANSKILFGILVAVALVIAFACEQKESIEMLTPIEKSESNVKLSFLDDKLKVEGEIEDLDRIKEMFSGNLKYEFETDSLGDVYIVKSKEITPNKLPDEEQVFFIVEDMPEFPGGEQALRKFIANSVKYPVVAQENKIQGKVYVQFVVTKDGSIANCKIARGVDPSLDKEALRVVNSLPKWKNGSQRGTAVNVSYTVPINFVLQ